MNPYLLLLRNSVLIDNTLGVQRPSKSRDACSGNVLIREPFCCPLQAESFPPTKDAIANEFIVVFSNASGRVRGKATVTGSTFTGTSNATVVAEYKTALHGLAVRGRPAVVAALIANHPDDVLSIELNPVVRISGIQTIFKDVPIPSSARQPGLWGLDRIDKVCP